MSLYYKNWFGDLDAWRDKDLFNCFTELAAHRDALHPEYFFIRAFKGSGKTAFQRQLEHCSKKPSTCKGKCQLSWKLCEEAGSYIVVPVDVTQISFETLYALVRSKSDPRLEVTDILRSLLKLSLVSALNEPFAATVNGSEFAKELHKMIKKSEVFRASANTIREVLAVAERAVSDSDHFSNVVGKLLFNDNSSINKAYRLCVDFLRSTDTRVVLVMDRFDKVLDLFLRPPVEKVFYHNTIATGLLEAAYEDSFAVDETEDYLFPCDEVQLKILFPEDLYSTLKPRDLQKYDQHSIEMSWAYNDLKRFLGKRIANFLNLPHRKDDDIDLAINALIDKKINNSYYDITEDICDYLLRHTLFKPRDLQQICVSIAGEFISQRSILDKDTFIKQLPITPKYIKEGVKDGTLQIVKYMKIEFQAIDLASILSSLHGKPNIMNYGDFYNHLAKIKINVQDLTVEEIISHLSKIGVIGLFIEGDKRISETYRMHRICRKESNYYVSLFSFSSPTEIDFGTNDHVVIAPLFYDALDTDVDSSRPIYPF